MNRHLAADGAVVCTQGRHGRLQVPARGVTVCKAQGSHRPLRTPAPLRTTDRHDPRDRNEPTRIDLRNAEPTVRTTTPRLPTGAMPHQCEGPV